MYRDARSFEQRAEESIKMRTRYPTRVPVIVEPRENAPLIDKRKYMTPSDLLFSQFMYVIRKRINLDKGKSLYFFANNQMIPSTRTLNEIYTTHKDKDGFLYISYNLENTFGA